MRNLFLCIIVAVAATTGASGLYAQDRGAAEKEKIAGKDVAKPAEKKEDRALEVVKEIYSRLDIGVKVYMDWIMQWGHNDPSSFNRVTNYQPDPGRLRMALTPAGLGAYLASPPSGDFKTKDNNQFRINRAYLDLKYRISDIFSARVTTDVDAHVTPAADSNAAFHIYLKYAFLEAKKDFGPVWISAAGGMIETPTIGLIDKISDYRWISQNYLDQSKNIIGQSLDSSADLGAKASIGIMKMLTLTAAFTNGGGYKKDEANSYKAISYLAAVNPIKEIYLLGFGRNEITAKYDWTGKKAKKEHYGYGIAYVSDVIRVGFNHIFPYVTTVGAASDFDSSLVLNADGDKFYAYPPVKRGHMLLDAYLNFNLGAILQNAPLLITGRFVYGLQRGTHQKMPTDNEFGKERKSLLYAAGIGWKFNSNVRILVGGEIQRYIVKKDRALRYIESRGTDWYSPDAANALFVGSHNPHDTKRVYVKTEVAF
ncbi:MAG: hypothetical protein JW807_17405 [Spirochaetes bacterium]|nr:hypothetical protein [Spirochaetota bacterium]